MVARHLFRHDQLYGLHRLELDQSSNRRIFLSEAYVNAYPHSGIVINFLLSQAYTSLNRKSSLPLPLDSPWGGSSYV